MLKYFVFKGRLPFEVSSIIQSLVWQSAGFDHTEEVDSGSV